MSIAFGKFQELAISMALVAHSKKCLIGPEPVTVLRRSTFFDLPQKLEIGGRVMYADHDAVEEK